MEDPRQSAFRHPGPPLAPFVAFLWAAVVPAGPRPLERMLPTGRTDLVVRLDDHPIVVRDGDEAEGRALGFATLSGARQRYYVRDASLPTSAVGAQLVPGSAPILGLCGAEIADAHHRLDDVWPNTVGSLRDALIEAPDAEARLDVLEGWLKRRLRSANAAHPAVHLALRHLTGGPADVPIAEVVRLSGFSHRHLTTLFRRSVGQTPKVYHRIRRFDRVARRLASGRMDLSELAHLSGFSDQAHLTREFRAFAGTAPGAYVPLAANNPTHLPIPEVDFLQAADRDPELQDP